MKNDEGIRKKAGDLTQAKMMQVLDWSYEQALKGILGQRNIDDMVNDYISKYDKETAINKLVSNQTTKAAFSGFVTGFGGIITLPVSVPANVTAVILFQTRMIAAIAKIRGYDLKSDQVQSFVYVTLLGSSLVDVVKKNSIVIGNKVALNLIKTIPGHVLVRINRAVEFRLVTKFGSKGVINFVKIVPGVGAIIGGATDTMTTQAIAKIAKKTFTDEGIDLGDGTILEKKNLYNAEQ